MHQYMRTNSRKHSIGESRRRGVAIVEAAVTFPLVALFVFALIQFVSMIFLRQKVTSACYVGMQQLAQPSATESAVRETVQAILEARGVRDAAIQILPAGLLDTAPTGVEFSIRVTAPFSGNIAGPKLIPTTTYVDVEQWVLR
jgi:hypothetical protein